MLSWYYDGLQIEIPNSLVFPSEKNKWLALFQFTSKKEAEEGLPLFYQEYI